LINYLGTHSSLKKSPKNHTDTENMTYPEFTRRVLVGLPAGAVKGFQHHWHYKAEKIG
jgi:hypothetical protein